MKQNLDNLLEQIRSCGTEEGRQALLNQEHMRIANLNIADSISELDAIALRTKEIRKSVEALKKERLVRNSIEKILNETTDVVVLEKYRQALLNLVENQELAVKG